MLVTFEVSQLPMAALKADALWKAATAVPAAEGAAERRRVVLARWLIFYWVVTVDEHAWQVAELRARIAQLRAEALPPWDPPTKADARASGPFLDPKTGKCCVVDWFDYSLAEKPRAKL